MSEQVTVSERLLLKATDVIKRQQAVIHELVAKYVAWSADADREYNRSRPIEVLVRIPYTPGNELALRGMTVRDLTVELPVALERVEVRCVGNPDWGK